MAQWRSITEGRPTHGYGDLVCAAHWIAVAGLAAAVWPWSSVYTRFRRWCAVGLWARLHAQLRRKMWGRIRRVDGSHIKVHWDGANPAEDQVHQAQGKTKGGLNTKLAAVVDGVGRAVGLCLARGPQHDLHACAPLQEHLRGRWVLADPGFEADSFRHALAASGARTCIPPRTGRRTRYHYDRVLYRHRRIATRYEKLAVTFLGFVLFATVLDWLNHEVDGQKALRGAA